MARDPNERFQSALEFKQALDDWAAAHDRALSSGSAGAQGAFLQGPGGFRGGGTQILNGPSLAAAAAQPFGPPQQGFTGQQAGGGQPAQNAPWQGPPQADASQMQPYPAPNHEPLFPIAEDTSQVAPKKSGSATLAFVIALLVVMVGGGAVAAVVVTKHNREAAKTSSSTEPATSASTAPGTSAAQAIESAAVPGASTQPSATSVLALPNASGAPSEPSSTAPPLPTSHPTGPVTSSGGHTGPMPTAKPTSQPSTQPTSKPTSGRPITGDL
jgi:hypothetical protein